jgi:hypothetical protein
VFPKSCFRNNSFKDVVDIVAAKETVKHINAGAKKVIIRQQPSKLMRLY